MSLNTIGRPFQPLKGGLYRVWFEVWGLVGFELWFGSGLRQLYGPPPHLPLNRSNSMSHQLRGDMRARREAAGMEVVAERGFVKIAVFTRPATC